MLHFEIFVVALTISLVSTIEPISINPDNEWYDVTEHEALTFNSTNTKRRTLHTNPPGKINLICYESITHHGLTKEQTCDSEKIVLNDAISPSTYTGCLKQLSFVGDSSALEVDILTFPPDRLRCWAKAVQEPKSYEVVEIKKKGTLQFDLNEKFGQKKDKTWTLKSTTGTKLLLQCRKKMLSPVTGVCVRDILTVDAGNGPMVSLGDEPISVTSEGSEISMSLKTCPRTEVHISCVVQNLNLDSSVPTGSEVHIGSPGRKSTTCPCGKINLNAGRIVNGKEVKNESRYPFMASLWLRNGSHICGASIISPIHILTAAHCVSDRDTKDRKNPADFIAVVGAHSFLKGASHGETQKLKAKEIHIPDGWFKVLRRIEDDIAIIELEEPMRYSKWVGPVCLTPTQPDVMNKFIKMLGWGHTGEGYPVILREGVASVINPFYCSNNVKEVCLGKGPSNTCYGDSGGPYVYADPETNRYTLIGLVSYMYNANCTGTFVGTNTTYWFHWIQTFVAVTSGGQQGLCYKVD